MLAGLWARGCAPACSRLAVLRKRQGPFSEQLGSSGTDAEPGRVVASTRPLDGLCTAPRVFLAPVRALQCYQGIPAPDRLPGAQSPAPGGRELGTCWEQEGRVGRGACLLDLSSWLPFPSCLSAAPGACRSPESFVMPAWLAPKHHLRPPAQPAEGTWGRSFLMLTSCVTVGLGRA